MTTTVSFFSCCPYCAKYTRSTPNTTYPTRTAAHAHHHTYSTRRDALRVQLDEWAALERQSLLREAAGTFVERSAKHSTALKPHPGHPGLLGTSDIITAEEAACVASCMPRRERLAMWRRTYSTKHNGISLHTLFRSAPHGASVLLVRDTGGSVFGAYCTEQWRIAPRYYGTGKAFVF